MKLSAGSWSGRFLTRGIVAGVAALVVIAANSENPRWYEELLQWLQPTPILPSSKSAADSRPLGPPVSVTPMRPQGIDSSISTTPLRLLLVRTERGRNSHEGFAQIGVSARSPQTYAAGALLANGARLSEIYDHYVILEHQGRTVRLYMQGDAQTSRGSTKAMLTVGGTADQPAPLAGSEENLTTYLRLTPMFDGNQFHGFALYPGRISGPFSDLGLQPGDVLTRIDGSPISDTSAAFASLRSLLDDVVLSVEIERQGSSQSLSLDGSILTHAISMASKEAPTLPAETRVSILSAAYPRLLTPEK